MYVLISGSSLRCDDGVVSYFFDDVRETVYERKFESNVDDKKMLIEDEMVVYFGTKGESKEELIERMKETDGDVDWIVEYREIDDMDNTFWLVDEWNYMIWNGEVFK